MLEFYAPGFLELAKEIGRLCALFETMEPKAMRPESNRENDKKIMINQADNFKDLGLTMCQKQAMRIADISKPVTNGEYSRMIQELHNRMIDECKEVHFLSLTAEEKDLYEPSEQLFGDDVANKMPELIEDIAEAGKCLGLHRSTAAVFHLMRVMEGAVKALSVALSIPNPDREWGKLLSDIHKEIEKMEKGSSRDQWSEIHALLYHVKQAWRNSTMHPKQTYTSEQAKDVFRAVNAFMRHLVALV
ncbi:MAG TPA: hypothetical protein VMQ73_20580 [Methylomirabilota bacterium]|nr:hypothetical protein [Methylomirabilota bacterium]